MCLRTFALLTAALLSVPQSPPAWRSEDAPSALRPLVSRADLAIAMMHDAMLRELSREFADGGADLAVRTCHLDTIFTVHRLGRAGIAAGRTSDRLRNPTNVAPSWCREIVRTYAGRNAREVDGFVVFLGDRVGVVRPVAETERCASCHGPRAALSAGVREVLADRYPADRAVGFRRGEIRGWFWVEIPMPRAAPPPRPREHP